MRARGHPVAAISTGSIESRYSEVVGRPLPDVSAGAKSDPPTASAVRARAHYGVQAPRIRPKPAAICAGLASGLLCGLLLAQGQPASPSDPGTVSTLSSVAVSPGDAGTPDGAAEAPAASTPATAPGDGGVGATTTVHTPAYPAAVWPAWVPCREPTGWCLVYMPAVAPPSKSELPPKDEPASDEHFSTPLMTTGIVLSAVGGGAALMSIPLFMAQGCGAAESSGCSNPLKPVGIAFLVGGGAFLVAGVPMWIVGAGPAKPPQPSGHLAFDLGVWPGGLAVRGAF